MLAACDSSATPATSLSVTMTDFSFTPSQFSVPAGQEITLELTNQGHMRHNFVIFNLGAEVSPPFDSAESAKIYWQVNVDPGQPTTTTFTAPPDPGDYQIFCIVPGHAEAGMTATLTVVKP